MELKIVSKSKDNQQVYKKRGEKTPSEDLLDPNTSVLQKQKYAEINIHLKKKTIKAPEPNIQVEGAN